VRCTRQFALIVARNAKSPSNLTQAGQFTAEIVGLREDRKEETIEDTKQRLTLY